MMKPMSLHVIEEYKVPTKTLINVKAGGATDKYENEQYQIELFINFIMYHFPIIVENGVIKSIFEKSQSGGTIILKKDITGNSKAHDRLVFIIYATINNTTT